MKAILCQSLGSLQDLVFTDIPRPEPGDQDVLVEIHACALNFPDLLTIAGKYQFDAKPPFIPGSEFAGVVQTVGPSVTHLMPGDRVIGFSYTGGFAEYISVPASQLFPIPGSVDFINACSLYMTYGAALFGLHYRGHLKADEKVLILGASGGIGLAAVQIARLLGAKVIAAVSSYEKGELCREYGAHEVLVYSPETLKQEVKQLTNQQGVDVVFDPVGGDYSEQAVRTMAWGGRYLIIGFAAGEIPRIPLNLPLLKNCSLIGVFWGPSRIHHPQWHSEGLQALLNWLQQGRIRPHISRTYPLASAVQALETLHDRAVLGKVVLTMR